MINIQQTISFSNIKEFLPKFWIENFPQDYKWAVISLIWSHDQCMFYRRQPGYMTNVCSIDNKSIFGYLTKLTSVNFNFQRLLPILSQCSVSIFSGRVRNQRFLVDIKMEHEWLTPLSPVLHFIYKLVIWVAV